MRNGILEKFGSFYFIGIGGVSMSALAKFMLFAGKTVAGSDRENSIYTDELERLGAVVETGNKRGSIKNFDAIVYTDAVPQQDMQLEEAHKLKKFVISRGEFLCAFSQMFKNVIAVSGCHGKTTCVSMLTHIFFSAGKSFSAHIGGRDLLFKNAYSGGSDFFLTEACEYKKNFLLLKPDISVILNFGADHLECYGSVENLRAAYVEYAGSSGDCIYRKGDFNIGGTTFGLDKSADYYAECITSAGGKYSFTVCEFGNSVGKINLNVYGEHNVINALAAFAVSRRAGLQFEVIKRGLENFAGVERRFERVGYLNGAECIADYAHHPDEIASAVDTAGKLVQGKLFVIFQPHTYSRTKNLFNDFVKVLSPIDNLLIYKTFAAREYFDDAGSALTLSQSIRNSCYGDTVSDITDFISQANEGDMVIFLGAGNIYEIAKSILSE